MRRFFQKFEQAFWLIWILSSVFFGMILVYFLDMPPTAFSFIITAGLFMLLPLSVRAFFLEGAFHFRATGQYERAIKRLKAYLALHSKEEPKFHEIVLEMADTYFRMGEMKDFETYLEKVDADKMLRDKKKPKHSRLFGLLALYKKEKLEKVMDYFALSLEETKALLPYVMYQYFEVSLGKKMKAEELEQAVVRKFENMKSVSLGAVLKQPSLKEAKNKNKNIKKYLPTDDYEWDMLQFYGAKLYEKTGDYLSANDILAKRKLETAFMEIG